MNLTFYLILLKSNNKLLINIIYRFFSFLNKASVIPWKYGLACFWVMSGFAATAQEFTGEQVLTIDNPVNKVLIQIHSPATKKAKKTLLIFYSLPNGNSIEWTAGKLTGPTDDWHYDIQHIAAQTRYLREVKKDRNIVVVYLANQLKSWPAWKRERTDGPAEIKRIIDSVTGLFASPGLEIMLNSHSGGGSFIFGYLDAVTSIPAAISRIGFIDSDYGYEDSLHGEKLVQWLTSAKKHSLYVLAYNDSVVIYNGKPLVSPTGGTWWRSQRMQRRLAQDIPFTSTRDTAFIRFYALRHRVAFLLKTNPEGRIFHTEQVARNGFIHTVLGGTRYEKRAGYSYWGERVYGPFISSK